MSDENDQRWKITVKRELDLVTLTADPNADALAKYATQAATALQEKISSYEEQLILQTIPTQAIQKLLWMCEEELERRRRTIADDGGKL